MKLVCLLLATMLSPGQSALSIEYQWKYINFTFDTESEIINYENNKIYEHVIPTSVLLSRSGVTFVGMPRFYSDVPATLGTLHNDIEIPEISAYPNSSFNEATDQKHFWSVVALEEDAEKNLWVLDSGKSGTETTQSAAKFVKIDTSGDFTYYYLRPVVMSTSSLSSFQVDLTSNRVYISDSSKTNPALIVYDLMNNNAVRLLENSISTSYDLSLILTYNEADPTNSLIEEGISPLALSCDKSTLYYAPLTSRYLYAINTKALNTTADNYVKNLGYKWSAGNGLLTGARGNLFISAGETNQVYKVDSIYPDVTSLAYNRNSVILQPNNMIWPAAMSFTPSGKLAVLSNNYLGFLKQSLNYSQHNFYVWSLPMNDKSSFYGCSYNTNINDNSPFPLWAIAIIIFCILLVIFSLYCFLKYFTAYRKRQKRRLMESRALND